MSKEAVTRGSSWLSSLWDPGRENAVMKKVRHVLKSTYSTGVAREERFVTSPKGTEKKRQKTTLGYGRMARADEVQGPVRSWGKNW